jgi:1-deoxy-D-xylulose-5-phosphate reductoisomerase
MNAANEQAVQAFIDERISLTDIPRVIEAVMDGHPTSPADNLATILEADQSARLAAAEEIQKVTKPASLPA